MNVENRHSDPESGPWPTVALPDIWTAGIFTAGALKKDGWRRTDVRKIRGNIAPSSLKDSEDISWGHDLPPRQRNEERKHPFCHLGQCWWWDHLNLLRYSID